MSLSSQNARHRRTWADDPTLCDRVFDLLGTWLPVLPRMRARSMDWRWRWEDASTPFVVERDGRVIAHVGVLEMELVCHGQTRRVGGIHAVCTLASERRRGLYRSLMEEALAWCDARYETLELTTENPEYYEPFGFVRVPEHHYRAEVQAPGGGPGPRPLDPDDPDALTRLEALLERRAPVSTGLAVVREQRVFKFNLAGGVELFDFPGLDCIAALSRPEPGQLVVHDVVAARMPPLEELLAALAEPVHEVRFEFSPDAMGVDAEALLVTDDAFMVRGEFPFPAGDGERLPPPDGALSPLARH